jgi:hypothetical protein
MKKASRRSRCPRPPRARISSMLPENDPFPGADAEPAGSSALYPPRIRSPFPRACLLLRQTQPGYRQPPAQIALGASRVSGCLEHKLRTARRGRGPCHAREQRMLLDHCGIVQPGHQRAAVASGGQCSAGTGRTSLASTRPRHLTPARNRCPDRIWDSYSAIKPAPPPT